MVPSVRHFESLTLWIQLRPGLCDCAWKVTNGHSRKLTKLVYAIVHEKSPMDIRESWQSCPWQYFRSFDRWIVILSVFMAPDRVVLPASRNKSHRKLLTCFSGRAALGLSFREHKVEMAKFVHSASKTLFYQPWTQAALFLIFAIAAASAAVSRSVEQFARWISLIPLRFKQIIFRRC